jgi:hypothetical protein
MIILCNKQTVLIIGSTCSGLTCNPVFRHLHFVTSTAHSTVRRALLSPYFNISFCLHFQQRYALRNRHEICTLYTCTPRDLYTVHLYTTRSVHLYTTRSVHCTLVHQEICRLYACTPRDLYTVNCRSWTQCDHRSLPCVLGRIRQCKVRPCMEPLWP